MKPLSYSDDFNFNPKTIWLNVASEGPLPQKANEALQESIKWKSSPELLTIPKFQHVPFKLKETIAQLIHVDRADVILGNSATYGLHLLANGLSFKPKDEIILLENDFPTDILPWLSLQKKSVVVHQLKAKQHVLSVQEIKAAITKRTRLLCISYVHSFSGYQHDIKAIGALCRQHGVLCVVNISQAAGVVPIDVRNWQVDAIVCAGYKWLLGPYGTGFCWIKKDLREQLEYAQNYWISLMDEKSLNTPGVIEFQEKHSAQRYDVFGTANFFNFVPWQASIEYLISLGIDKIHQHNQILINQIIDALDDDKYFLISPQPIKERTNIIVFSHKDKKQNPFIYDYLKNKGIYLGFWRNNLRISPHLYNTAEQINKLIKGLNHYGHP